MLDDFDLKGPNGSHKCLVYELLGPSVPDIIDAKFPDGRLPGKLAKTIAKQCLIGLDSLHQRKIGHGDLHTRNLAFAMPDMNDLTEGRFFEMLGKPEIGYVQRRDGKCLEASVPEYVVKPASYRNHSWNLAQDVKIIDFGESFLQTAPPKTLHTPLALRAPEVIFQDHIDYRVDLWSMGCMLFELFVGQPPFDTYLITPTILVGQMREMATDELPERWQEKWNAMNTGDAVATESTGPSLQEWLEEVYFDSPLSTDLTREDIRFFDVHWIWMGGISFVYEVHPRIVVKVPKPDDYDREQFQKEVKIYEIFSQHPPCPSIVQCFLYADNGIFLEYMRDVTLCTRIQHNHTRDQQTAVVTKVEKLEPLSLRKEWMNDLAQAVAFLESLNLAHGDLRPENILLDRNRLKLTDFDCTAEIGSDFEACMAPYGRLLSSNEQDQGRCGSSGYLGPRTEQFALGSLYYFINYGFEVYGDRCLTEDPKNHLCKVVDLLQNLDFAELAAYTETLLPERNNWGNTEAEKLCTNGGESNGYSDGVGPHDSAEDFSSQKHSVRTWKSAAFSICFLWASQSNLDSRSSGIDIPQVEANAQLTYGDIDLGVIINVAWIWNIR
ncbi:hypothetical protein N7461_005483 [Penicillium sp. DV-2018c]|nr:hypothetical protein N7461_005483 [Penicillium sp. DV-2018c]